MLHQPCCCLTCLNCMITFRNFQQRNEKWDYAISWAKSRKMIEYAISATSGERHSPIPAAECPPTNSRLCSVFHDFSSCYAFPRFYRNCSLIIITFISSLFSISFRCLKRNSFFNCNQYELPR